MALDYLDPKKDMADPDGDERDGPPKKTPQQIADYWLAQVQSAEKKRKSFITRGKQILKRYKNKRTLTTLGVPIANRRMTRMPPCASPTFASISSAVSWR